MITWIEDPLQYSYLRKADYMSCSNRFPVKTITQHKENFSKLIGYELTRKTPSVVHPGVNLYYFDFYWLKTYDRDLSPGDVYEGPKGYGGHMPYEAVDPFTLVQP